MIRHLILVATGEVGPGPLEQAAADLRDVREVDGVHAASLHADTSGRSQGYDRMISVDFRDEAAMAAWNEHASHERIVSAIKDNGSKALIFDYPL